MQKGLDFNGPNDWEVIDIVPNLDRICNELTEVDCRILKINLSNIIKSYTKKEKGKMKIKDKNYYKYKNDIEKLYTFLKENKLNIIRADKSKQVIVVTLDWIMLKKLEIVKSNKFRELPINPKDVIYDELKNRITKLQKLKKITKNEKDFILYEDNDRTPRLNIQLKTHKKDENVRPIVDFKFAVLYNLEKFLKQKLKVYKNSKYSIKNTDDFLDDLKSVKIENTYKIASLDVIDMYPSIKWELIENQLKKIDVEPDIIELLEFAYKSNYFELEGKYYTQENGISMGSVIGPKLAEIIMTEIDERIRNIHGIKYYKRYVDDVLIIYNNTEINIKEIEEIINNIDTKIQFTIEKENDVHNSIRYLDVVITRKENKLEVEPYKKPCSIETTIRYNSNIPMYIKKNGFHMEYTKIQNRTKEISEWKRFLVLNKTQIDIPNDVLETMQKGLDFNGPNDWEVIDIVPNLDHDLLDDLKSVKIENTYKIASLDVTDMYPSIKWELIENQLKKIDVEPDIIELLEFAYKSNYFELEGKYYTQENGISMGPVIGPKLAEIIMT
ncbi:uncharacterized protein LOC111636938 [Centruroides sculpturatus]|uniref:uncharacterized protein LOC111636938 n=1 Tax=Centruroides sculpturatus TaxID=218467 RepID=UPI000C6E0EEE|nr:uncharacterized protein LOC111636938 [Centruroides sculpturatus]